MKFSSKAMLVLAALAVVHAENCDVDVGCTMEGKACTDNPTGCCEGFGCYGFNFFKRCQVPPVCRDEWHSCNPNPGPNEVAIECCTGTTCVKTPTGLMKCQKPTPEIRTIELPGFNIEQPPTTPPPKTVPKTFVCEAPIIHEARLTGDPHFRTFDGLTYDCQGKGEFIVFKAADTSREVQGRFTRIVDKDVTVAHGIAMRDQGGPDVPKVQVSIPVEKKEGTSTVLGNNGCQLQLFVDGAQHPLIPGDSFKTDLVTVNLQGGSVTTTYKSGFQVKVEMGYWNGCLLNTYLTVPTCEGDKFSGLLGDADKNSMNDWKTRAGALVTIPNDTMDRRRKPAYEYCTQNWCINDKMESLFFYNEIGYDHGYYGRCGLPFGTSLVEFVVDLPADIVKRCAGDLGCMMDALNGDDKTVEQAVRAVTIDNFELEAAIPEQFCSENADCAVLGKCCDGYTCLQFSATDWRCKKGIPDLTKLVPQCNPVTGGYCDKVPCCGGMQCAVTNGGASTCQPVQECVPEKRKCSADTECCTGMKCVDLKKGKEGNRKTFQILPAVSKEKGLCFPGQNCDVGLICERGNCMKDAALEWGNTCFKKDWAGDKPCAAGLKCMPWQHDRKVCADPGLDGGALKKGVLCPLDGSYKCKEGLVCNQVADENAKKLKENLGELVGASYGQCEGANDKQKRTEYRLKAGKAGDSSDSSDDAAGAVAATPTAAAAVAPADLTALADVSDAVDRSALKASCTLKYYRIKSTSSKAWEATPGYGANDCILQNAVPAGTVSASGTKFSVSLQGTLKLQNANVGNAKCWIEKAGHKAALGCFYSGTNYHTSFKAGLSETKFDTSKCASNQDISHVEMIIGCCGV